MSKVQLQGNVSGTGVFTIASPNSNTDRTLTLPDNSGTVLTNNSSITQNTGSAFAATAGGGFTAATAVNVLVPMTTEEFDVNGDFNNTGSTVGGIPAYAFRPSVAGYYLITYGVQYNGPSYGSYFVGFLYKNGITLIESVNTGAVQYTWTYASRVVYLNGSSDYIQIYVNQGQGTTQPMGANVSGALIRRA
jgi:hypothetical protein